jgi:hypothetical protein
MRPLPVLLACAAMPFAAGCGAGSGANDAADTVAHAAARTAAASTLQIAIRGTTSAAGQAIRFSGTGVYDLRRRRGAFHQSINMPGKAPIRIDERSNGFVLYLRSRPLTGSLPAGKHWLELDLQALGRKQGIDLSQLEQVGTGADPTQWLTYLRRTGAVEKLGSASIHGVRTTRYHALIDLDKVAANAGKAAPSVVRIEQGIGAKKLGADVWIDREGRVRREALAYSVKQPAPAHLQLTIDFVRFDVPAHVQLPAARDAVALSDLVHR